MTSAATGTAGQDRPATARRASRRLAVERWCWFVWTALLSGFLVITAGENLGSFPMVSGDDAWIMSASHKLAVEGVFGSDMFSGFANAERRYFIALPVYHALQAGVFALFGTSVAAARAVTLASGLVVLWCVAWLARRWHGVAAAIVATGLLVFWRAYFMNLASGLSFISVSRTGRYDVTAVAFVLLALVGLDLLRDRRSRPVAFTTGLAAGLAALTQFFGAFVVPLIAAILVVERGWRVYREPVARWLAAGWLVVVIPYAGYVAAYWSDFVRQSEIKTGRIEFGRPGFYLSNLRDEPDRYLHLFDELAPVLDGRYERFDQPLSPFLFAVAAILALVVLAARIRRDPTRGERRLAMAIAVFALCLSLFDGTNAPLYGVILLPLLCIAIALMLVDALRWAARQRSAPLGVIVALLVVAPTVVVFQEGVAAYRQEREWSRQIAAYEDVAAEIDALLPAGAPALGMERWWAGLHQGHDYIAIAAVARQLPEPEEAGHLDWLADLLAGYGIAAIIVDDDAHGLFQRLPEPSRRQFDDLIRNHGRHAGTVAVHPYGQVDVYLLDGLDGE